MAQPTLADARELSDWRPPLGVLSVYLRFEPGDRTRAWRTELKNQVGRIRDAVADEGHERRMAVIATTERLLERFESDDGRPPPRGEAGFLEVAERKGAERWWAVQIAPVRIVVALSERPLLAPFVDLAQREEEIGVALLSSERVRLLRFGDGALEEIEEMEITMWSDDWRERKASSSRDPAHAQGVSSSGHDQFDERLDHNRRRFLGEAGALAGRRLKERGLGRAIAFGPAKDVEEFASGLRPSGLHLDVGGDEDLISTPTGSLIDRVAEAVERLAERRDRELAERALGKGDGAPGATSLQETATAIEEGRVERLVVDPAIGEPAEELVRGALAGGAEITVARDGVADLLEPVGGAAAILRY